MIAPTITIAICTFRRPTQLARTLQSIAERCKLPPGARLVEILVVDNDPDGSRETTLNESVDELVRYIHEPQAGIAAARNRCIAESNGDVLCFIDDDETVGEHWPVGLLDVMADTGASLVGGPVITEFVDSPPEFIIAGGFFDRQSYVDGQETTWLRTGNLALSLYDVRAHRLTFDEAFSFTGGEDVAFSRRAVRSGLVLRASADATVVEHVDNSRASVEWLIRRERQTAASFVRAQTLFQPAVKASVPILARSSVRLLQGSLLRVSARLSGSEIRSLKGQLLQARAAGSVDGLLGRHSPRYGDGLDRGNA